MVRSSLMALALCVLCSSVYAETNFVQQVIDGQTLKLISGEELKLIGFESHALRHDESISSVDFLRSLVSGRVIEIEYDENKVDEKGQLMGYVWFEYDVDHFLNHVEFPKEYVIHYKEYYDGFPSFYVFLNATMIKSGHGKPIADLEQAKYQDVFNKIYATQDDISTTVAYAEPTLSIQSE